MWKQLNSDAVKSAGLLLLMLAFALAANNGLAGDRGRDVLEKMRDDGPNETSMDEMTKNYYEGLLQVDRETVERTGLANAVAGWFAAREELPADWTAHKEPMEYGPVTAFLFRENVPHFDGPYKNVHVHMNRWGQRSNTEFTKERPAGTFRIAVCGGSNTMGFGVPLEDTFTERLAARLNRELGGRKWQRFEVINFSSNGYHLLDKTYVADTRFAEFQPNLAIVDVLEPDMGGMNYDYLGTRVAEGRDLHFDFLKELVTRSGARKDDSPIRMRQKLKPLREAILTGCLRELHELETSGRLPAMVVLALRTDVRGIAQRLEWLAKASERQGLMTIRVYDALAGGGMDMYVHPRDYHLSAKAHRLVADEVYDKMLNHPRLRSMIQDETGKP